MYRSAVFFAAVCLSAGLATASAAAPRATADKVPADVLSMPTFGRVTVYVPTGTPSEVVLFVSGDGGWSRGVVGMAGRLRDLGALVVGIDIRTFIKSLDQGSGCAYPAGPLEDLSRRVQQRYKMPVYKTPILAGYSSGATLVYAALAAAPSESFAGALSLGFCPDIEIHRPLCEVRGLNATKRQGPGYDLEPYQRLKVPWIVLQGDADQVCSAPATAAFVGASGGPVRLFALPEVGHGFGVPSRWEPQFIDAYRAITSTAAPAAAPRVPAPIAPPAGSPLTAADESALAELSLDEVTPRASTPGHDAMAIILTGDGGWAELDKGVAESLSEDGVPSVGWSSLRYYWTPRTPDESAADLARIIRHYTAVWQAPRVVLVGYSFGADVLPFLVNRLPPEVAKHVSSVVLLGPSAEATFQFHVTDWIAGEGDPRYPTVPEIQRLPARATCVTDAEDHDSVCHALNGARTRLVTVGRGHHFSGDYAQLATVIRHTLEQ